MNLAHKRMLRERLETLLAIGEIEIHEQELRMWYDYQRVTSTIWKDIYEKWDELWEEYKLTNFWKRSYKCNHDFIIIHYEDKKIYKLVSRDIKNILIMVG